VRRPKPSPKSQVEQLVDADATLKTHPPPPGLSPLRWRLLRLCLTSDGAPCPVQLGALRRMSLREALQLEAVAHHRQREALLLQDALRKAAEAETEKRRRARAKRPG